MRLTAGVCDAIFDQALSDPAFMEFARCIRSENGFDVDALAAAERRNIVRQIIALITQQKNAGLMQVPRPLARVDAGFASMILLRARRGPSKLTRNIALQKPFLEVQMPLDVPPRQFV